MVEVGEKGVLVGAEVADADAATALLFTSVVAPDDAGSEDDNDNKVRLS